jgi:hypothetical protein
LMHIWILFTYLHVSFYFIKVHDFISL